MGFVEELDGFGMASGPKWKYTNTKALQLRDAGTEAPAIWPPGSEWDGMVEDVEAPRWIILLCRFLGFSRFSAAKSLYIYIIFIMCIYIYYAYIKQKEKRLKTMSSAAQYWIVSSLASFAACSSLACPSSAYLRAALDLFSFFHGGSSQRFV